MGTAAAVQRSAYPPHTPKLSGPKYNQSNQSFNYNSTTNIFKTHFRSQPQLSLNKSYCCWAKKIVPLRCGSGKVSEMEAQEGSAAKPMIDFHGIDEGLVQNMVYDALVWSSLHGLVVGDKNVQKSGEVPGVGMMHAPFSLLPVAFPENHWKLACEVAPICNELVDRVSLDGNFLQESLSRTKKVDDFTSRLLDIHSKMLEINKKEEIRLGLHRSDYMLDGQTKSLLQIELNTISSSFSGLSCLVSELHRSLLKHYGKHLGLDPKQVPVNSATNKFAEALAKAWTEYDDSRLDLRSKSFIFFMLLPPRLLWLTIMNVCTVLWLWLLFSLRSATCMTNIGFVPYCRKDILLGIMIGFVCGVIYFLGHHLPLEFQCKKFNNS
uniref:Glutathione synthetase n=1 Tax=Rhizophora mucronata TaxID=61149 RepID=A0A2P2LUT9_RHIMU